MSTDSSNSAEMPKPDSVRFIPERVADTDQFQHKSVAQVLARVIVRHPQLRTIGLLGKWGSGKSTTISYIPSEVENLSGEPCLLFAYDAWLYQSDAPRPAFIDALFEFLVKEQRLNRADWTDHVAILTGHLQVTYASERPFSSLTSRAMLLALLGLPVAGLILDHHDMITKQWSQWTEWRLTVLAAFLAVMPIAVWVVGQVGRGLGWVLRAIGRRLLKTLGRTSNTPTDGRLARWLARWRARNILILDQRFSPKPRDESWSWILSRKPQATEQRKVGKSTPSTADFQRAFRSMVTAALDAGGGRQRLIIAVDNLDRLPIPEAVALWAVIRSFFLGPTTSEDIGNSRLTVILPMDEHYVAQVQGQAGTPSPVAPESGSATASDLAQGLMEKTFDLTLRLPRPTFVNWQGYFAKQLAFALFRTKSSLGGASGPAGAASATEVYDVDDVDVVEIGTILNDAWHARAERITPRMVNAMVNRIIATWLRWEASLISLQVVAYYAINQDDIDRDLLGFLQTAVPLQGVDDYDWESWLAALHFGIEPHEAIQVLLMRPMRDAIDDSSAEQFRGLSHREGFTSVMKSIVASYDMATFDITVLQAAELFATVQVRSQLAQTQIHRQLCIAFNQAKRSGLIGPEHVAGLHALLRASGAVAHLTPSALLNQFVGNLGDVTHGWSDVDRQVFDDLMAQVEPPNDNHGRPYPLILSTEPMTFFDAAEVALKHKAWIKALRTDHDDRVLEALNKKLDEPQSGENALIQVIRSGVSGDWKATVHQLIEGFEGRNLMPLSTAALGLGFLRHRDPRAQQTLHHHQGSMIPAAISTAFKEGDMTVTGRLLSLALLDGSSQIPTHAWTDQERLDRIDDLVDEMALDFRDFGSPAERSIKRLNSAVHAAPHLAGVMSRVFAKWLRADPTNQGLGTLLVDLSFYRQHASIFEIQNLIEAMSSSKGFWNAIKALRDDQAWPVLKFLRDSKTLPSQQVEAAVLMQLTKMQSRDWAHVLRSGGPALDGLAGIARPTVPLPELAKALDTLIDDLSEQPRMLGRWAMTVRRLPDHTRTTLFSHLAEAVLAPKYASVAGAAVVYMPELIDCPAFQENPDLAVTQLIPGMILSSAATDHIVAAARALSPIVQRASPSVRKKVEADLFTALSEPRTHTGARALGKVWGAALSPASDA
jgi:hypothetical protein